MQLEIFRPVVQLLQTHTYTQCSGPLLAALPLDTIKLVACRAFGADADKPSKPQTDAAVRAAAMRAAVLTKSRRASDSDALSRIRKKGKRHVVRGRVRVKPKCSLHFALPRAGIIRVLASNGFFKIGCLTLVRLSADEDTLVQFAGARWGQPFPCCVPSDCLMSKVGS